MSRGSRWRSPAFPIACLALFAALGGTVYAAARKIDGRTIKVKSLPGNRLKPGSLPANRLQAGTIPGSQLQPGSVTGAQVDTATLGQVPSAVHADSADSARDAQTALNAVNAVTATKVNGYEAGCHGGTTEFAGACWQLSAGETALSAPAAASSCASRGGSLPEPLQLVAFAQQPGVTLAAEEWTSDVASYTDVNEYSVVTVTTEAKIKTALSTATKQFRCVIPLVG